MTCSVSVDKVVWFGRRIW